MICQMLYEQQRVAGIKLAEIEDKVASLRENFTNQVLSKHPWEDKASVDKLFAESSCAEVTGILKGIGKKNNESKLSSQFDGVLNLGGPGPNKSEPLLSSLGKLP